MSEEEALTFCEGKLARYKMPKLIKFVSELPMTAAEKIKRNMLREAYLQEQRGERREVRQRSGRGPE
jgi:acyl-CoA synthetase (AMP-forming)/AMP-acid ligase II